MPECGGNEGGGRFEKKVESEICLILSRGGAEFPGKKKRAMKVEGFVANEAEVSAPYGSSGGRSWDIRSRE